MENNQQPFTKADAIELSSNVEKLFDAKLETVHERITGLRNWFVASIGAILLLAGSSLTTHQPPSQQVKTAVAILRTLL